MIAIEPASSPSFSAPPTSHEAPQAVIDVGHSPQVGEVVDPGSVQENGLTLWRRAVARGWWLLVLALVVLGGWVGSPLAAQETEESEHDEFCDGLHWVPSTAGEGTEGEVGDALVGGPALALSTDVQLTVHGPVIRGTVTQRYVNPHDGWVEGVYRFPLPTSAALDGLRMVVGDRVLEGQIHEKEEARRVYEQARREGVRTTLVEQRRPNLFTTRVANVGPGEQVEVTVTFQWLAEWRDGLFSLRMPMTFTPRYTPGPELPPLPTVVASSPHQLPDQSGPPPAGTGEALRSTVRRASAALEDRFEPVVRRAQHVLHGVDLGPHPTPAPPVQPLVLSVDLAAGTRVGALSSASHRLAVTPLEATRGHYRLDLEAGVVSPDRDFELTWRPELGDDPRPVLFHEAVDGEVYALLMVLPPAPDTATFTRLPRETIFILDVSGSMQGASIRQAKEALLLALDRLQPEDSFNVLAFNHQTRALFPGSWPARPDAVDKAKGWVRGLDADGGTEMLPALMTALDNRPDGYGGGGERALQQVIFMTDGAVSNEGELFSVIEEYLGDSRLFTVGIGSAPNGHFMEEAARLGRGTATFVQRPDQVGERMGRLFEVLENPTLTGVAVRWDDPGAESFPERVPDLYAGEPVVVTARLLDLGDEVLLSGERDGLLWDETVGVQRTATPAVGVGKVWARSKIDHLMTGFRRAPEWDDEGNLSPERSVFRERVVQVALAHHLVSAFTSLVAVDVTPSRPEAEALDSGAVPNVRPAGASWNGHGFLPSTATSGPRALALGIALLLLALALRWLLLPEVLANDPLASGSAGRGRAGSRGRR